MSAVRSGNKALLVLSLASAAATYMLLKTIYRYRKRGKRKNLLSNRPHRKGTWFVVDRSILSSIEYEEMVDIYNEFFRKHPNGSGVDNNIVAIRLSNDMLARQLDRIRMSSYRWDDVNGIPPSGEYAIPRNYNWFLEKIKRDSQIGWMDFIAGIGVNCSVAEVIEYMGGLYARVPTVGAWMYNIESLDQAMYRGWIFQETAFGALDSNGCRYLFSKVRESFVTMRNGDKSEEALALLIRTTSVLGKLIHRRGFEVWRDRNVLFKDFTFDKYGNGMWLQRLWGIVSSRIGITSGSPLRVFTCMGASYDGSCDFATFGTRSTFSGSLVWAEPECAESDLTNAGDLIGKIMVVRRGKVNFIDKSHRAAKAGAIALVVVNTDDYTFRLSGDAQSSIAIPVVCVSSSLGGKLLNGAELSVCERSDLDLRPFFEQSLMAVIRSITPLVCLDIN